MEDTNINRLEVINLASVIYDKVEETTSNYMVCRIGNEKAVLNYYGTELLRVGLTARLLDTDSERFLAFVNEVHSKSIVSIVDTVSEKKVEIKNDIRYWGSYNTEIKVLEDKVIVILDNEHNLIFLNSELERIGRLKEAFGLTTSCIKCYPSGFIKGYYTMTMPKRSSFTSMYKTGEISKYTILIDAINSRILSYEVKNIVNSIFDAIAVEQDEKYECLVYKLGISNKTISEKSYHLIEKPLALSRTDLFQVYNKISKDEYLTGLISEDGTEVLEPIYSEIQFLATDIFVLSYKRDNETYKGIFKREQGMIVGLTDAVSIVMHPTLPVAMIWLRDGSFKLMDNQGNKFGVDEFSRHFNCSYVGNVIKVDLGYKTEFITTQLTPVTNRTVLSKLEDATWIDM